MRDDVADRLVCPGCGAQLSHWADVGVKHNFEKAHDRRIDETRKRYQMSLIEFQAYLRDYPYPGADHPVGRRILKEIRSFPAQELTGQTWFHARRVASGRRITTASMFPPDPGRVLILEGRYNHAGQVYWYLASTQEAAAAEAAGPSEELAWVQSFKIEPTVKVLDVRAWEAGDERLFNEEGNPHEIPLSAIALIFTGQLVEWVARIYPSAGPSRFHRASGALRAAPLLVRSTCFASSSLEGLSPDQIPDQKLLPELFTSLIFKKGAYFR